MKFVVECLSKECLDVFNNNATTTTICAHDGQILAIALVAMAVTVGPLAIVWLFREIGMSVEAHDRYRRWREDEERLLTAEKV